MWHVYYADGTLDSSDERSWSDISHRVVVDDYVFDVLNKPATEIAIRAANGIWHRLKAQSEQGEEFYHYNRGRINLGNGALYNWYEAAGFLFPGGRVVLEVTGAWSVTRVELGEFSFESPAMNYA